MIMKKRLGITLTALLLALLPAAGDGFAQTREIEGQKA